MESIKTIRYYHDENYIVDPAAIRYGRPRLSDMIDKVITHKDDYFIEKGHIPTVNVMMRLWEKAMQQKHACVEDNVDFVFVKEASGNSNPTSATANTEARDNEDIVELSTLFDSKNNLIE